MGIENDYGADWPYPQTPKRKSIMRPIIKTDLSMTSSQLEAVLKQFDAQGPVDPDPGKVLFEGGAGRSKMMPWYTFIPRYVIARIAKVFEYGANKYGLRNWQKGDQKFIDEIPDHIVEHIYAFVEEVNAGGTGKDKEDHLANIGCNITMLMHFQQQGKYPTRTQG